MNIIHEFKAPIANITILFETLYEYESVITSRKKMELIELGIKETSRLNDLINQFLYLKEDLKTNLFKVKDVAFRDINEDIDITKSLLLFRKNFLITRNFYVSSEQGLIRINKDLYCNAILNLVENSSKFIYGEGHILTEVDRLTTISVHSFTYKNLGRVAVIDNGVGISGVKSMYLTDKSMNNMDLLSMGVGMRVIDSILSFHDVALSLVTYPKRGSKFFFDMDLTHTYSSLD